MGAAFNDGEIKQNFSSATAIRKNLSSPLVKDNIPDFVAGDLTDFSAENARFENYLRLILSRTTTEALKPIYGCGDGLENVLKALQTLPYREIVSGATSKRYPSARIKRILLAKLPRLYREDCEKYLSSELYLSPLAVQKEKRGRSFGSVGEIVLSRFNLRRGRAKDVRGCDRLQEKGRFRVPAMVTDNREDAE